MKKLSFLLAMIMILSSFVVMPVFAAASKEWDGTVAGSNSNLTANGYEITYGTSSNGPQKATGDVVYHISGKMTGDTDLQSWLKYGYNFSQGDATECANGSHYLFSLDFYIPSIDGSTEEMIIRVGTQKSSLMIGLRTGAHTAGDTFNTKGNTYVYYGIEPDKWHNFAVTYEIDPVALTSVTTVYIDGVKQTSGYRNTSSSADLVAVDTTNGVAGSTKIGTTTIETGAVYCSPGIVPTKDAIHNYYVDNVKINSLDNAYDASKYMVATMTTTDRVTVDNSAKTLTMVDSDATIANIMTASNDSSVATASEVEIYRADVNGLGGYSAVAPGSYETNDIVKIKSTTGAYSYYTLVVNESATEFFGDTNASICNFGSLTYANSVQAPLTEDTLAYKVSGEITNSAPAGFGATLNSPVDGKHYAYKADFYIDSSDNDNKEFVVNTGVTGFLKDFVFRSGDYANTDTCGIDGAKVFYGVSTDRWHKLVIAVDVDDNNIVTLTPYIDGVKQEKYHTVATTAVGAEETAPLTSASAVSAGYKMQSTIKIDNAANAASEKYNFYFDTVSYEPLSFAYATTAPAEISSAVNGVITVSKDSSDQAPLVSEIKTLCAVDSSVTFEVYDSTGATSRADGDQVADGDIIKLTTAEGIYSYYTINVLTRDQYLVKEFNDALTLGTDVVEIFKALQLKGYFAGADINAVIAEYEKLEQISDVAFKAINDAFYAKTFTTGETEIIDFAKETVAVKTVQAMVSDTEFGNFVTRVGSVFLDSADVALYNSLPSLTPAKDQSLVNDAMVKAKAGITTIALLKSNFHDKCIAERDRVIQQQTVVQQPSKGPSYSGGKVTGVVSVPVDPEKTEENTDDYSNTASPFSDLANNHWAYNYIMSLVDAGILSGYQDGSFKPEEDVLREEIVKMLIEAFSECDKNATSNYTDFSDSDWFYPYVATAIQKGYINGVAENVFGAGQSVSRQDCVVMIYNIIQKLGVKLPVVRNYTDFADEANIESYAKNAVKALYCAGIIDGTGAGFNPDGDLTRAEAAKIIFSVLKIVKG